ncbi:AAA family ATPase [Streptomyces sp. NPDC127039]|uniref:helix-turn-helix transcriptional regulator n=1 Tax=Streptomyces sp. NPDC127039 TaxID=3347115 RepID=UPI00364BCF1A
MATTTRIRTGAPFTVRSAELQRLLAAVHQCAVRRGGVMEVGGDPGVGKTRLLTALTQEARARGLTVVRGTAAESYADVPFQPFLEAFGNWFPGPGDPAPHPATALVRALADPPTGPESTGFTDRCRFYAELRTLLAACVAATDRGLLLLLDDAHRSDIGSVELLDMLVRRPVTSGLTVVVAHRPRQTPVALRAVLQQGVELGAVEPVRLGPVTVTQSADLLQWAGRTQELTALHARAAGNPLYLMALAETVPGAPDTEAANTLTARLLTETALLEDTERTALYAAAVLGDTFDVDGVAEVAALDRDAACRALGALRRRDLVRTATAGHLAFRHPLIRRALYAESDACWRAGAHRRATHRLAALGAPPVELAPHIERAGTSPSAADLAALAEAARAALHLGRVDDAAHWLTLTLGATGTVPEGTPELWRSVVRALAGRGAVEGIRTLGRGYLASPAAAATHRAADVAFLAGVYGALGHADEARGVIAAHLSRAADTDPAQAPTFQVQLRLVQVLAGSLPTRSDVEALVRGTRDADAATAGGALALHGLSAVLTGDICTAETRLGAAARLLDYVDTTAATAALLPEHLLTLGWAESLMGRHGAAVGHIERAVPLVRENGDEHLLAPMLNTLAYAHYQSGRMADALDAAQEARTIGRAVGRTDQAGLADAVISAALAQLGGAAQLGRGPAAAAPTEQVPRTPLNALLHAEAALARGDGERALSLLLPTGAAWRVSEPVPVLTARCYELLAAAALLSGARDKETDIAQWAEYAAEAAAGMGLPEQSGHALLARGHLLARRGRAEEAARTYEDAVELLGGETPAGVRGRQLARRARAGAGRGTALLVDLTVREREVADLAGQGFKSKDIAERLSVSPRTVDVHLTRIYSKLGVDSKAALARLMAVAG